MKELNFFTNWNQKLDCKAFTTLRLSDRYIVSDKIEIKLKNKPHSYGEIIAKKYFLLKDITEWIAYIDTGYSKTECQDILKKMYKNKNINWTTQNIYLYLIRKIISLFDKENNIFI